MAMRVRQGAADTNQIILTVAYLPEDGGFDPPGHSVELFERITGEKDGIPIEIAFAPTERRALDRAGRTLRRLLREVEKRRAKVGH